MVPSKRNGFPGAVGPGFRSLPSGAMLTLLRLPF